MNPQPKDIYIMQVTVGYSTYPRPCVIIEVIGDLVTVVPLSSALDLYNPVTDFMIENTHPDFIATGLQRTSYVSGQYSFAVPAADLSKKRRGCLSGELGKAFDEWMEDIA
jgi:hypothetical protein